MPILRLRKHQANFSDEDILINQADYPGLKLRDVVELRPPRSAGANQTNSSPRPASNHDRVLLQLRRWPEINQSYPNTISIKETVVNAHLKLYADVLVNIVDKKEVLVDSIEICFSNAYLARSYMWGLRNHLNNRCVYQRQKLDYLHIRSQICEIWAQGDKVTSGYMDDDTKIVFRSASSLVYLFIQMSSEMWDYDINGDLYCEKAINGFLRDLFDTWRQNECSHDITIVLFSRTFYDAESLDEFPEEMRECLQVDYKGRFYEDCYRVAFQNDRFDLHDWSAKLTTLKSLFNQYQREVINRHQEKYLPSTKIPRAYNSSASQGNFLEVLNMSLNVFEKHYFDRSFDRTGQLSVVVSPGVGVFEVDFEMTNLTKQRIIDNGIGSDLVCLGEQPLHTVPLLKFNSKSSQLDDNLATCDVYNMPHWINLSFYSSQNQVYYSNFVPRIKLPTLNSIKTIRSDASKTTIVNQSEANTSSSSSRSNTRSGGSSTNNNDSSSSTTLNEHELQQLSINAVYQSVTSNNNHLRPTPTSREFSTSRAGRASNGAAPSMSSHNHHHHHNHHHSAAIPDLVDYDEYDAQVFKSNSMVAYHCQQQVAARSGGGGGGGGSGAGRQQGDRSILADMDPNREYLSDEEGLGPEDNDDEEDEGDFLERDNRNKSANIQRRSSDVKNYQEYSRNMKRQASENLPVVGNSCVGKPPVRAPAGHSTNRQHQHHQVQSTFTRMSLVDSYLADGLKIKPESADDLSVRGYNVHSSRLSRTLARPKALINPFDPSHMTIKLTPNRRRWTHVFPQGPTGTFIQQHHYQQPTPNSNSNNNNHKDRAALPYLAEVLENEPLGKARPAAAAATTTTTTTTIGNHTHANSLLGQQQRRKDPFPVRPPAAHATTTSTLNSMNNHHQLVSNQLLMNQRQFPFGGANRVASANDGKAHTSGSQLIANSSSFTSSSNKSTLVSNDTIRFAWCASGEQVWTPAITTGVDWKSLTMPACLPLTTDFFPSKTSLQNDYVISEYNIDSSFIHSRYTLIEVYRELVCQRLQKGFQIILLPGQQQTPTTNGTITAPTSSKQPGALASGGQHARLSSSSSSSTNRHHNNNNNNSHRDRLSTGARNSPLQAQIEDMERERTDYTMSIGRIFHKLALNGNTITVTHYRPRHPYPTIKIDYCYRFRAPFHETYGQSWVHFKSEKLENYNWNYLDNYICARGESTFALRSSLKFWRFRVLILPSKLCLRKLPGREHAAGRTEPSQISAGTKDQSQAILGTESARHDLYYEKYSDEERGALMESFMKLLEIINKTRRASACRLSSGLASPSPSGAELACSAPNYRGSSSTRLIVHIGSTGSGTNAHSTEPGDPTCGGAADTVAVKPSAQHQQQWPTGEEPAAADDKTTDELKFESINMDIDSALRDARRAEWVHVQYHNFFDVRQAFELIIKWMVASGAGIAEMVQSWSRKMGNSSGVHVVPIPWEPFAMPHSGKADPLRCPLVMQLHLNCLPDVSSLDDNQVISLQERILRLYGFVRFHDLISSENIERQYIHMSGFAFVALPNLIGDQEASQISVEQSPRRIEGNAGITGQQPVLVSQDARPGKPPSESTSPWLARRPADKQAAAPGKCAQPTPLAPSLKLIHQETISSPHEEYITRHIGGARQNKAHRLRGENEQIEFIWSWNYMLTKRWRSNSTQDESYAVSLMQDFKDFCSNGGDRLVEFWHEIKTLD